MSSADPAKSAYVIMPVGPTATCTGKQWTDVFEQVFTPAFKAAGYGCHRAQPSTGNLIKSLITELRSAWLVLADLTDRNANVFYELGVRHSLSKRTILVARNPDDIPSDLRGYWWLDYGLMPGDVADFRTKLVDLIRQIEADPDRSDSPVSDFLNHEEIGVSAYMSREGTKKLSALFTELSGTINTLWEIDSDVRYSSFLQTACLDLLLTTLYVDVGSELLKQCHELRHALKVINAGLNRDPTFISDVRTIASTVMQRVRSIQQQLSRGEFIEPLDVSVMVWSPVTTTHTAEATPWIPRQYSQSADLSQIDLDLLQRQLNSRDS